MVWLPIVTGVAFVAVVAALALARVAVRIRRELAARKDAEEALARERNLLRTLMDHLPDYTSRGQE